MSAVETFATTVDQQLESLSSPDLAVDFQVFRQVVGAREAFLADFARVRLVPRVRAFVTRQFVGARELPVAPAPRAHERLLAGMAAQVRLQVRALAVHLVAAGVVAVVNLVVHLVFARRRGGQRRAGRRGRREGRRRGGREGGGGSRGGDLGGADLDRHAVEDADVGQEGSGTASSWPAGNTPAATPASGGGHHGEHWRTGTGIPSVSHVTRFPLAADVLDSRSAAAVVVVVIIVTIVVAAGTRRCSLARLWLQEVVQAHAQHHQLVAPLTAAEEVDGVEVAEDILRAFGTGGEDNVLSGIEG